MDDLPHPNRRVASAWHFWAAMIAVVAVSLLIAGACSPLGDSLASPTSEESTQAPTPRPMETFYAVGGNEGATLYWGGASEPSVVSVEITWSPGSAAPRTVASTADSCTVTGLTNGVEYTFTAKYVDGTGTPSEGQVATCTPAVQVLVGGSGDDEARSIDRTADGGYVIAGSTTSSELQFEPYQGHSDVYVVKLNSSLQKEWSSLQGGVLDDVGQSIEQTADGGCIVGGYWEVTSGVPDDFYAVKLNANGARTWERACGGSGLDQARSVRRTLDGGYLLAGESFSTNIPGLTNHLHGDFYVVKLDANGATTWQQMFGGTGWDQLFAADRTSDGGYIVVGMSDSTDIPGLTPAAFGDFYVAKLDSTGLVTWQRMWGGKNNDYLYSVRQTTDGGYIVSGTCFSSDLSGTDGAGLYVAKLDASGIVLWQRVFPAVDFFSARSVLQTTDGGYIFAGYRAVDFGLLGYQCEVVKLDAGGNTLWERIYGGRGNDQATGVVETSDGSYLVGGFSDSTDILGAPNSGGTDYYMIKVEG